MFEILWHLIMRKGATVLENGTPSAFEVITESLSGVHTALKTLAPQEKFTLERSSSDSFLQHWVVIDSAFKFSFNSDELIGNDRVIIVCEGNKFNKVMIPNKVMNPRVFESQRMPNPRLQNPLQEGGEGQTDMYSVCKPPLMKSFKRIYNSLTKRASEDPLTHEPHHGPANSHPLNHLHSV